MKARTRVDAQRQMENLHCSASSLNCDPSAVDFELFLTTRGRGVDSPSGASGRAIRTSACVPASNCGARVSVAGTSVAALAESIVTRVPSLRWGAVIARALMRR